MRCPLCKDQGITVPADDVAYTENGVRNTDGGTGGTKKRKGEEQRAAPSVLKWGGGHAQKKKELRTMGRKQCNFGADCRREDCFFAHPKGWGKRGEEGKTSRRQEV